MNNSNTFYTVKNLSPEENRALCVYLYSLSKECTCIRNINEFQTLFNALVKYFHLEQHLKKVTDAVKKMHIKAGNLTKKDRSATISPYDTRDHLSDAYREDEFIYDRCCQWKTDTLDDVELVRAVFADDKFIFPEIVAYTFFCPENANRKTFSIPLLLPDIPTAFKKAVVQTERVRFLVETLRLSADEGRLLNTAYLTHTVKELYPCANELCNQDEDTRVSIYAKCSGLSVKTVKGLLHRDKNLVAFDLMDHEGQIESDAMDCIFAGDLNLFFSDVLKKDDRNDYYELDTFSVPVDESELALRLFKNDSSTNLLLYGEPGSGKTEYARTLALKSGLTPYIFKNELEVEDDQSNPEKHALNRLNCLLSLKKDDSVIIVDEAENLLSTRMSFMDLITGNGGSGNGKKGTVNTMLERSVNKVIWILNYTKPLDESTLRRFTYSIRFREMSKTMLRNIADTKLGKLEMSDGLHARLVELCGKYHVTGASVDNVVKTIRGMNLSSGCEEQVVSDVQKVLEANSTLIFGKKKMREMVQKSYDLSVLNSSVPANEIVDMVMNAQSWAEETGGENGGVRMLFYGVSGTGKTELARYIAEKLNRKICLKRVSDIMGKYVGENEKNIAAAFAQAEESGDILLFDEADSFFSSRKDASTSWERTMVNEFLTQMEEFSGILICTTNLKDIMDPAMHRRFHIMAEFKPLRKDGIRKLLGRFFPTFDFSEESTERLYRYSTVTPGDFGVLSGKMRFMPRDKVTSDWIIDELCHIQDEKPENSCFRIGFAS